MKHPIPLTLAAAALVVVAACGGDSLPTDPSVRPSYAKPAPPPPPPTLAASLPGAGSDLLGDGKGDYVSGICGVSVTGETGGNWNFVPATSVPSNQQAACAGIAPRAATLVMTSRHVSDNPHVDAVGGTGSGSYSVNQLAIGSGGGTLINAPNACFIVARNGKVSGRGLRFDADNFPGSNDLILTDLGGGGLRAASAAYPNNLAFCEDNNGVSFWHVSVDITFRVVS